jgi:hypothetical protein
MLKLSWLLRPSKFAIGAGIADGASCAFGAAEPVIAASGLNRA